MKREYGSWRSGALSRPMEFLWFGDRGRPVLMFPTSMGRFYQNEDFGLTGALADKVDAGFLQLICVDSVDEESWYNRRIHPRTARAPARRLRPVLRDEMLPFIESRTAAHRDSRRELRRVSRAANLSGRYPGASRRSASRVSTTSAVLNGYWDDVCYHTPRAYIANMDGGWLERLRQVGGSSRPASRFLVAQSRSVFPLRQGSASRGVLARSGHDCRSGGAIRRFL